MRRYDHVTAAVMSGDVVHIVSFGGFNDGSMQLAATAVIEMSESLLLMCLLILS